MVVDGRMLDAGGYAGEIGHTRVTAAGDVRCACGQVGCLETLASAAGVARTYARLAGTADSPTCRFGGAHRSRSSRRPGAKRGPERAAGLRPCHRGSDRGIDQLRHAARSGTDRDRGRALRGCGPVRSAAGRRDGDDDVLPTSAADRHSELGCRRGRDRSGTGGLGSNRTECAPHPRQINTACSTARSSLSVEASA